MRSRLAPAFVIVLLLAASLACSPGGTEESTSTPSSGDATASAPPPSGTPRLVLQIVVDQMRGDYVERFRPLLEGGLAHLADEGFWFTDAHHEHSETLTAAGHATIASGLHPANHGLVGNSWVDKKAKREVYCVEDEEHGRSPANLLGDAFGDRLKARYAEAKVFSFGGKDRSSILCGGHHSDGSYWYDRATGELTTSTYYASGRDGLPSWLEELHDSKFLDQFFGKTWEPLLPLEEVAAFGIEPLDFGYHGRSFPYSLGGLAYEPDRSFYGSLYSTPFVDTLMVEAAKAAVLGEDLGGDEIPDFLSVALSALDSTGHGFGPDSPEMLDTLLRVDRLLGELFAFLDEHVGMDQVLVSLSSDHGVGIVPELAAARGLGGGRFGRDQVLCAQAAGERLGRKYDLESLVFENVYIDRAEAEEQGVDADELAADLAEALVECPGIARAIPASALVARGAQDQIEQLLLNAYREDRSPDVLVVTEPNWLTGSTTASHGSPYPYDTHVPWMLLVPGTAAAQHGERVATADVMPTLAGLTDVDAGAVDGTDRSALLRP